MIDVDGSEISVLKELFSVLTSQARSSSLLIETDYNTDGSSNQNEICRELLANNFKVTKVIRQSIELRFSPFKDILTKSFLDLVAMGMEGRPLNQCWLIAQYSD